VVVTYREDPPPEHPWRAVLSELVREPTVHRLVVPPRLPVDRITQVSVLDPCFHA
jgi:hypothetical protein